MLSTWSWTAKQKRVTKSWLFRSTNSLSVLMKEDKSSTSTFPEITNDRSLSIKVNTQMIKAIFISYCTMPRSGQYLLLDYVNHYVDGYIRLFLLLLSKKWMVFAGLIWNHMYNTSDNLGKTIHSQINFLWTHYNLNS